MVQIFLQVGTTSWADPGDWNPGANLIECLGSGAGSGPVGYYGSGGGAYAYATNIALAFPVQVSVQGSDSSGPSNSSNTQFGGGGSSPASSTYCSAQNGGAGAAAGYGLGGTSVYPAGYSGGNGADGFGGGGGAAGPHGAGGNGTGNSGGSADGGVTPAPALNQNGIDGTQWGIYGCGSGGSQISGSGGQRGGAAGGPAGVGAPGLIIITYSPLLPPPWNFFDSPPTSTSTGELTLGFRFVSSIAGYVISQRAYIPNTQAVTFQIWDFDTGVAFSTATASGGPGWVARSLTPVPIQAGKQYWASWYGDNMAAAQGWSYSPSQVPITAGPLTINAHGFNNSINVMPDQVFGNWYGLDIEFVDELPSPKAIAMVIG